MKEMSKMSIKEKWTDKRLAHEVAKLMYAPGLEENVALIWLLERLILPPDMLGYTGPEIRERIEQALKEAEEKWEPSKTDANPTPKA